MTALTEGQRLNLGVRYEALRIIYERLDSALSDMQESESRERQVESLTWLENEVADLVAPVAAVRIALIARYVGHATFRGVRPTPGREINCRSSGAFAVASREAGTQAGISNGCSSRGSSSSEISRPVNLPALLESAAAASRSSDGH